MAQAIDLLSKNLKERVIRVSASGKTVTLIGLNGKKYFTGGNKFARGLQNTNPELFAIVHGDYLTGQYNSFQLAEKHGLSPRKVLAMISRHGWKKELLAKGLTVPAERYFVQAYPKLTDEQLIQLQKDYINDVSVRKLAEKYNQAYSTIRFFARQYGWISNKQRLRMVTPTPFSGADLLRLKIKRMDDLTGRFVDSCFDQMSFLLSSINIFQNPGYKGVNKKITTKDLEQLVKTFERLHGVLMKIKSDLYKNFLPKEEQRKLKSERSLVLKREMVSEDPLPVKKPVALPDKKAPVRMVSTDNQINPHPIDHS